MMQSELCIRAMAASDLSAVLAIERSCFADPWTEGIFRSSLGDANGLWLVCLRSKALLGYGGLSTVLDEGNLDNLAVHPEARRQGVAAALLDALIAACDSRSLAFLTLEVRAGNSGAIALYEKKGFVSLGLRRGYYLSPPEDALIMKLDLERKRRTTC